MGGFCASGVPRRAGAGLLLAAVPAALLAGCASTPLPPPPAAPPAAGLAAIQAPPEGSAAQELARLQAQAASSPASRLRVAWLLLQEGRAQEALTAAYQAKFEAERVGETREAGNLADLLAARAHLALGDTQRALHFARQAAFGTRDTALLVAAEELERGMEGPPPPAEPPRASPRPRTPGALPGPAILSRQRWGAAAPIRSRMEGMGRIRLITVHHSGFDSPSLDEISAAHLVRAIQRNHIAQSGYGDIGYHYLIDRAGRIWGGRPVTMQGAHAGDNLSNRGNIGVCLLGDFDRDRPSTAQVRALEILLHGLLEAHRLPLSAVATHREVRPGHRGITECPGRHLQEEVDRIRAGSPAGRILGARQ